MLKSHTDFNIQHANHNNGNNSIQFNLFVLIVTITILFALFCATTDKTANKNNCKTAMHSGSQWVAILSHE